MSGITILAVSELAIGEFSHELEGAALGVHASSSSSTRRRGARREATFFDGVHEYAVAAGSLVVVAPEQPHGFVDPGRGRLRQIDVHLSERFDTRWLARRACARTSSASTGQEGPRREPDVPQTTCF